MSNRKTRFARELRRRLTDTERRLWLHLRDGRLAGAKFRRQQPIGPYIVDFVCIAAGLVVELDGGQHLDNEADRTRDAWFESRGFRVMRIWDNEVWENLDGVKEMIHRNVLSSRREGEGNVSSPSPPKKLGERGIT